MKELFQSAKFLSMTRRKLRYGAYSSEPLLVLRFEWKGDNVECDWLMRPPHPWDLDLAPRIGRENQTLQALKDALILRETIFDSFPAVITAKLHMYRADSEHRFELMMTGTVSRSNEVFERVTSVAMRAKLCGFQFSLKAGELESMPTASLSCT
jgi:hypothetical protein